MTVPSQLQDQELSNQMSTNLSALDLLETESGDSASPFSLVKDFVQGVKRIVSHCASPVTPWEPCFVLQTSFEPLQEMFYLLVGQGCHFDCP